MLNALQLAACLHLPSDLSANHHLGQHDSNDNSADRLISAGLAGSTPSISTPLQQPGMDSSMQATSLNVSTGQHIFLQGAGNLRSCHTESPAQLQDFGGNMVPVVLQDGTILSMSTQHISTSPECPQHVPMQLQDMQQQQQQASTLPDTAAGHACPVMLQDGTVLLFTGQQNSGQGSSAAPIVLQAPQQQQQVVVLSQGMAGQAASTGSTPMLVLQGSAGSQQLQQLPMSLGPLEQQHLFLQQHQLPQQQQQNQLPQQQVVVLAAGEQLVCSNGPMQQQSHLLVSPPQVAVSSGSMGHSMQLQQLLGSAQGLSCAGQAQLVLRADPASNTMQQVQFQGLPGQLGMPAGHQQLCTQGSGGQMMQVQGMQAQSLIGSGLQGQVVQVQTAQGQIVQGTIVMQGGNTNAHPQHAAVLPAANVASSGSPVGLGPAVNQGPYAGSNNGSSVGSPSQVSAQANRGPPYAAQGASMGPNTAGGAPAGSKGAGRWQQHDARGAPGMGSSSSLQGRRSTVARVSAVTHNQGGPKQQQKQAGGLGSFGVKRHPGRSTQLSKPFTSQPLQGLSRVGQSGSTGAGNLSFISGPVPAWASATIEDGLAQLWSGEQLQFAKGGRMFNVQQLAWHPAEEPEPRPADLYNFQRLKRIIQKLDAMHKVRAQLIKRIHAVAESGGGDLKAVYRDVRGLIGLMLQDAAMQIKSLSECRVVGLIRLALMLQVALEDGPTPQGGSQQQLQAPADAATYETETEGAESVAGAAAADAAEVALAADGDDTAAPAADSAAAAAEGAGAEGVAACVLN